ncbi:hypothetical protein [Paenibacillus sambharensis]|uniref:hypothetical protein n=1 Tax=Paenibacillus sambharensis TaxID=1803190 RepID=UPI0011B66D2D|nr:hypothetical protein [Paenibacillus sambharensis]
MNKLILWALLIVPWFTLFFMKKESIKRYMPVGIFTALITTITFEIAYHYEWWIAKDKIVPWGHITNPAFPYGAFLVLTLWIFYFTYRNFWLYMFANIVLNAGQWYFVQRIFEQRNMVELVNISRFQLLLLGTVQALVIYAYQRWQEGVFQVPEKPKGDGKHEFTAEPRRFRGKEGAR